MTRFKNKTVGSSVFSTLVIRHNHNAPKLSRPTSGLNNQQSRPKKAKEARHKVEAQSHSQAGWRVSSSRGGAATCGVWDGGPTQGAWDGPRRPKLAQPTNGRCKAALAATKNGERRSPWPWPWPAAPPAPPAPSARALKCMALDPGSDGKPASRTQPRCRSWGGPL
jgi:hypothetical protein